MTMDVEFLFLGGLLLVAHPVVNMPKATGTQEGSACLSLPQLRDAGCVLVGFVPFWVFLSCTASEEEAHRERHCHHRLPRARRPPIHPQEHSFTLPACLRHSEGAQPLH